jgi:hypothetical protein
VTAYPHRLRLYGGRNAHAARTVNGGPDLVTPCGYLAGPKDVRLDDATLITCRACNQQIKRSEP